MAAFSFALVACACYVAHGTGQNLFGDSFTENSVNSSLRVRWKNRTQLPSLPKGSVTTTAAMRKVYVAAAAVAPPSDCLQAEPPTSDRASGGPHAQHPSTIVARPPQVKKNPSLHKLAAVAAAKRRQAQRPSWLSIEFLVGFLLVLVIAVAVLWTVLLLALNLCPEAVTVWLLRLDALDAAVRDGLLWFGPAPRLLRVLTVAALGVLLVAYVVLLGRLLAFLQLKPSFRLIYSVSRIARSRKSSFSMGRVKFNESFKVKGDDSVAAPGRRKLSTTIVQFQQDVAQMDGRYRRIWVRGLHVDVAVVVAVVC